jgi:hypothetical protein
MYKHKSTHNEYDTLCSKIFFLALLRSNIYFPGVLINEAVNARSK